MRISVIGCGYLGVTHAVGMAEYGFDVVGVETDEDKRASLQRGVPPFAEPRLADLLLRHVSSGRLVFTGSHQLAGANADVHFLCVGTPQEPGSLAADVSQLDVAVDSLAPHLRPGALVVGKSTVPAGTAKRLAEKLARLASSGSSVELAWNPEFLREGNAVEDTLSPDRLVFGVESSRAEQCLRHVYKQAIDGGTPVIVTDYATAEVVKAAANAFLATKVSFINAVAEVCELVGADVGELADALGFDARIGRRFLNAGVGFGGGCLPKDIRSFQHRAGQLGADRLARLLGEIDSINQLQRQRCLGQLEAMVGELRGVRVGVLGAAFKPFSDDVRDSPALFVAGQLQLAGADVVVFDPAAMAKAQDVYPTLRYADDALEACTDADALALLTEWPEFTTLDPVEVGEVVRHRRILDGRNALVPSAWRGAGWEYRGVGRR